MLSGDNSDYFLINSTTGQISLAKSLNYEDLSQPKSFNLTVGLWIRYGAGNYVQSVFAVSAVNDVNEAPIVSGSGIISWRRFRDGWEGDTKFSLSWVDEDTDPRYYR
jgi:hypothetical protein